MRLMLLHGTSGLFSQLIKNNRGLRDSRWCKGVLAIGCRLARSYSCKVRYILFESGIIYYSPVLFIIQQKTLADPLILPKRTGCNNKM